MQILTEDDLVAMIKARLPRGSRLEHFEVSDKKDLRWVAHISVPHTEITGYISHFACSSKSMVDALSRLLDRLTRL